MLTHGSDRARRVGEKVILQSAISKGWTPRTPKTLTHAEFPGTAVLWEEQYFEVIEADGARRRAACVTCWRSGARVTPSARSSITTPSPRRCGLPIISARSRQRRTSVLSRLSGDVPRLSAGAGADASRERARRARVAHDHPVVHPRAGPPRHRRRGARRRGHAHELSPVPAFLWPILPSPDVRVVPPLLRGHVAGPADGLRCSASSATSIYRRLSKQRDRAAASDRRPRRFRRLHRADGRCRAARIIRS